MQSLGLARPIRSALSSMVAPLRIKQRYPPSQELCSFITSNFLSLPTEIRLQIYKLVFTDSEIYFRDVQVEGRWRDKVKYVFTTSESKPWSILLTCKTCYQEAHVLFIEMMGFVLISAYNAYTIGNSLQRLVKDISDFSRKHLVEYER